MSFSFSPFFRLRRVRRRSTGLHGSAGEYKKSKELARAFILARLQVLNQHYGFAYQRVAIRNSRSRWGSCSQKGNLNFHYRLLHLPAHLTDYVIVHELCHLAELNHSPQFWALVAKTIPDWKTYRRTLRGIQFSPISK